MDKLPMCRICLVEDVRMYVLLNKDLHELYEKLTDVPFITEDSRPMLACFFCYAKLKQCWRLLRKCLEAEELFSQMMNDDYEADPLMKPRHLDFFNGLSNSSIEHMSIVGGGQTESNAIKEELPDVSEGLDDITGPGEEHHNYKLELDNVDNSCPDVEDTPAHHAESDSDDLPLIDIKTEVEDELESIGAPVGVVKKPKLDTQRFISAEQNKNGNNRKMSCVSKIIKNTQNDISKRMSKVKKPFTKAQLGVTGRVNITALGTICCKNTKINDIKCKMSKEGVDSDGIKRYQRACVKEKRFKCDICQRSFSVKCNLVSHTRTHTGEKPFKCDICPSSFGQKNNLVNHSRTHTNEKPFKCNICQCSFSRKHHLETHIYTHTGEKPYKCDICQRSYSQKYHFIRHIRDHTGGKHFKCDICQRSFNQKHSLLRHIRTHTGEKPFKCDICQRSFNEKNNLVKHIRTHTGEKPFKCDICQRSFNEKSNLVKHIRTHSDENPLK